MGHLLKLIYYVSLVESMTEISMLKWYVYPTVVVTACIGTSIGNVILHKMNEAQFRKYSKGFILCIGTLLIARGVVANT